MSDTISNGSNGEAALFGPSLEQLKHDAYALEKDWSTGFGGDYYVGQEEARQQLEEFLSRAPEGSIATLKAPFGTGKSTLLYTVFDDLERRGLLNRYVSGFPANEVRVPEGDYTAQDLNRFGPGFPYDPPNQQLPVLFIEEIGRGADIHKTIEIVNDLRARQAVGRVIFTGDETLTDPRFFKALGVAETEVTKIELRHVTGDEFKESIRRRLNGTGTIIRAAFSNVTSLEEARQVLEQLEANYHDSDGPYTPEYMSDLFDPQFLNLLTYPTDPPTFQYREARALIYYLISRLKKVPKIDGAAYQQADIFQRSKLSASQRDVLVWLYGHIRDVVSTGQPFRPLRAAEIVKGTLGSAFDFEHDDVRELLDPILIYRGSHGLRELDTTEFDVNNRAYGLKTGDKTSYVPKPQMFLDAFYQPMEPNVNTGSEEVEIKGSSPKEKADHLFSRYAHSDINLATYRAAWNKLVREQMDSSES